MEAYRRTLRSERVLSSERPPAQTRGSALLEAFVLGRGTGSWIGRSRWNR